MPTFAEALSPTPRLLPTRLTTALCLAVIIGAAAVLTARAYYTTAFSFNDAAIQAEFSRWRHIEARDLLPWQNWTLLAVNLALFWGPMALAWGYAIRLFYGFLQGDIFTLAAARRLFLAGAFTAAHPLLSLPRQVLVCTIATANTPDAQHWYAPDLDFGQLYDFALGCAIMAMAQVHAEAARMADDARHIL
jgi:hypothetical protein